MSILANLKAAFIAEGCDGSWVATYYCRREAMMHHTSTHVREASDRSGFARNVNRNRSTWGRNRTASLCMFRTR